MVLCAQSSLGYPRECLAYYFELLCKCLFINKLHSKSFLSNFWGAVHFDTASLYISKQMHKLSNLGIYNIKIQIQSNLQ